MMISIAPINYHVQPLIFQAAPGTNLEDIPIRAYRHKANIGAVGEHHGRFDADRTLTISAVLTRSENDRLLDMLSNDTEFTLASPEGLFFGMIESRQGAGGVVKIKFLVLDRFSVPVVSVSIPIIPALVISFGDNPAKVFIYGRRQGSDYWWFMYNLADSGNEPEGENIAITMDGQWAVFCGDTLPYAELYQRSGDSFAPAGIPLDFPPAGRVYGQAFSDDGRWLALAFEENSEIILGIWEVDEYGTGYFRSTDPVTNPDSGYMGGRQMNFHPSGNWLALPDNGEGSPWFYLYSLQVDVWTRISSITAPVNPHFVKWSPDGATLAICHESSPYLSLYSFDTETETLTLVSGPDTAPTTGASSCDWTPDGLHLAVAGGAENVALYSFDSATGIATKLTSPDYDETNPPRALSWSPDGAFLAVTAEKYLMTEDGSGISTTRILIYGFDAETEVLTPYPTSSIDQFDSTSSTVEGPVTGTSPLWDIQFIGSR